MTVEWGKYYFSGASIDAQGRAPFNQREIMEEMFRVITLFILVLQLAVILRMI